MNDVTFLGVEGSGKTVLTTALVNLFKAHEKDGWYLRPDSRESFRFLEQASSLLNADDFPHQTTSLKRLAWSAQLDGKTVRTFDVLDYPGEIYRLAFLEAKDDPDPSTFAERVAANKDDIDAVLAHLMESNQVFVLFNLADAADLSKNASNLDAVWVTNACLDYLHRLPNHPAITLLLTQIDRYADINSYELDPNVYIANHLPLIHRNFPNLDVLAVSAVGPADATYGVDSILLRCLFECDVVRSQVNELRDCSKMIHSWFDSFTLIGLNRSAMIEITARAGRCSDLVAKLPWFIPLRQLQDNGFIVDDNEIVDERTLLGVVEDAVNEAEPESRIGILKSIRERVEGFLPQSKIGLAYRRKVIEQLDAGVADCELQIKERISNRKKCKIAIIVFAIIAAVELLIGFGRMLF